MQGYRVWGLGFVPCALWLLRSEENLDKGALKTLRKLLVMMMFCFRMLSSGLGFEGFWMLVGIIRDVPKVMGPK